MDFSRGNPQGSEISACVSSAIGESLSPCSQGRIADLPDADTYLVFFAGALEYSSFPSARRPPHVASLGQSTRISARNLVTVQIRGNLHDNRWTHASSLGAVADVSPRVSPHMGNCRLPSYIPPTLARGNNNCPLSSPCADMDDINPYVPVCWAAVAGNLDRARRGYLRACETPKSS